MQDQRLVEVRRAERDGRDRHDDVVDQRLDHRRERRADDEPDRDVRACCPC